MNMGKAEEKQSYIGFSVLTISHSHSSQGNTNTNTRVSVREGSSPFALGDGVSTEQTLESEICPCLLDLP